MEQQEDNILVPLDGSPVAEKVLPYARNLAQSLHRNLLLFQVALPVRAMLLTAPQVVAREEEMAMTHQRVVAYFSGLVSLVQQNGMSTHHQIVEVPETQTLLEETRSQLVEMVSTSIIQRAAEPDIALVVMGNHGALGGDIPYQGGVVGQVLARCVKPVLVVRVLWE